MSDVYLGIDFGTQSVKCVFCEIIPFQRDQQTTARILVTGKSSQLLVQEEQDGYAEQNPLLWINAMKEAIRNALTKDVTNTIHNRVRAIGISGQQHGLVALDSQNNIIRPCMLWCDTRAKIESIEISQFSGRSIPPGFTAPKIMWMINNEPDNYHRTDKFMLPHDYINYYLSGYQVFTMECGDASGTGLINFTTRDWDHETINHIHPNLSTKLPSTLTPANQIIGNVASTIALELGISYHGDDNEIRLAPGCGDNAMTILGISAVSNYLQSSSSSSISSKSESESESMTENSTPLLISLGTSGTIMLTSSHPMIDPNGSVALFGDATGRWLSLVCLQNCSMVPDEILNSYLSSNSKLDSSPSSEVISSLRDQLISLATNVAPDCEGITLLPYFSSGGERTPNWPHASGCFLGLRHGHLQQTELLYRAALEGVTYSLFRGYQELNQLSQSFQSTKKELTPPLCHEICVVGGGAQNQLWKQIIADIFNLPVTSPTPDIGNHAAAIGGVVQAIATSEKLPFDKISIQSEFENEVKKYLPELTTVTREAYQRGYQRHVTLSNLLFENKNL